MTKKELRIFVQATIEHYLDALQELTHDYMRTFELWEMTPEEIMLLPNNETKLLACALNVAKGSIIYKQMKVSFSGGTFNVKIKTF